MDNNPNFLNEVELDISAGIVSKSVYTLIQELMDLLKECEFSRGKTLQRLQKKLDDFKKDHPEFTQKKSERAMRETPHRMDY